MHFYTYTKVKNCIFLILVDIIKNGGLTTDGRMGGPAVDTTTPLRHNQEQ